MAFPPMMEFVNTGEENDNMNNIPKMEMFANYEDLKETEPKAFTRKK